MKNHRQDRAAPRRGRPPDRPPRAPGLRARGGRRWTGPQATSQTKETPRMLPNSRTGSPKIASRFPWVAGLRHAPHRRRRTRFLAAVEPMEERALLSTFTVTNTNDSGSGSLRDAINAANTDAGTSTD